MKKFFFVAVLSALASFVPVPTIAGVDISIGFSLPPPIVFSEPPAVIVLPDTYYVYVVPDMGVDIYFWNGWWWRPWEGRWYRSRYYDRGWGYYDHVPRFYYDVDPGWRGYYRSNNWYGHRWNHEWIPYSQLHQNWKTWNDNHYWERRRTWSVQNYQPRPQQQRQELRNKRQKQYQQRPEVQRHQQQRAPQVQKPKGQEKGKSQIQQPQQRQPQDQRPQRQQQQRSEPRGQQHRGESERQPPQGKSVGGDTERR